MNAAAEYVSVNGYRIRADNYERRTRNLRRKAGRHVLMRSRGSRVIHDGRWILFPPEGRQVYPRVRAIPVCRGAPNARPVSWGSVNRVTCKRCLFMRDPE